MYAHLGAYKILLLVFISKWRDITKILKKMFIVLHKLGFFWWFWLLPWNKNEGNWKVTINDDTE